MHFECRDIGICFVQPFYLQEMSMLAEGKSVSQPKTTAVRCLKTYAAPHLSA